MLTRFEPGKSLSVVSVPGEQKSKTIAHNSNARYSLTATVPFK